MKYNLYPIRVCDLMVMAHSRSGIADRPKDLDVPYVVKILSDYDQNHITHQQLTRIQSILHDTTPEGNTPLHLAVRFEWWKSASWICREGAPLGILARTNSEGQTPMHLAAMQGGCQFLDAIKSKASADVEGGGVEQLKQMAGMVDGNGNNTLHLALRNAHEDVASKLIDLDGPVLSNSVSRKGESPLYLAARRSLSGIVKKLLEFDPPNYGGPSNQTALHAAAMEGDREAARALLEKKPNIDREKDAKGQTPLHHAVYWGNLNMVKLLLEHNHSTAYYRDLEGHLPIHIAVQLNNVKIFLVLYSTCPDSVDVRNKKGENVLHMAIRSSSTGELVKFIGIRSELRRLMNHQDENGNTPLHLAILEGRFHRDFNLFLQSKEVDPWVKNNIGDTAIDLFCSRMDKLLPNELGLYQKLFTDCLAIGEDKKRLNMINLDNGVTGDDLVSRFEKHASNVALVATIMATITFAAAFTMPGGYDQTTGNIFLYKNTALRIFLIADTVSMCCSLLVAYLYSSSKILRNPAMFHQNYAVFTRYLMETSFMGMMLAFAAGMYSVVPFKSIWLANVILILCAAIPVIWYVIERYMDRIESSINPAVDLNVWVYSGMPEDKDAN